MLETVKNAIYEKQYFEKKEWNRDPLIEVKMSIDCFKQCCGELEANPSIEAPRHIDDTWKILGYPLIKDDSIADFEIVDLRK